jgi:hypothetical protein
MTRDPYEPYNRVHIGPDRTTVLEHCTTDLYDDDPIAVLLAGMGIEAVTLRFIGGATLTYSKRTTDVS